MWGNRRPYKSYFLKPKIKICPYCKRKFRSINPIKKFCSFYCKMKENNKDFYKKNKKPIFICDNCKTKQNLNFDPIKEPKKFDNYICINCGRKK